MNRSVTASVGLVLVAWCAVAAWLPTSACAQAQGDVYYSWGPGYGIDPEACVRLSDGVVSIKGPNALKADGTVWVQCSDQLLGLHLERVPGLTDIVQISGDALALKRDGTVWTWRGGIAPVPGLAGIVAISSELIAASAGYRPLALKADGTVWAWGAAPVGDGTTSARSTPVQIPGLSNVTDIASCNLASYVLTSNGTVWAWGKGPLGEGSALWQPVLSPVRVPGLSGVGVRTIRVAYYGGWAIKTDGTALGWGFNQLGNSLGVGAVGEYRTPVPVVGMGTTPLQGISDICDVGDGSLSYALMSNGKIQGFGRMAFDQCDKVWSILTDVTAISRLGGGFLRNDSIPIEVGAVSVGVPEGGTATLLVRLAAAPTVATTATMVPNAVQNFKLGQGYHTGRYFSGMLDDARVYGRALSAAEIQTLAGGGTANQPPVAQNRP